MEYCAQDSLIHVGDTLFTMVPKNGELQQAKNWGPIAAVETAYKIFGKMVVFETVCGKGIKWNSEIWFARF